MSGKWRLTRSGDSAVIEVETFPGERLLDPGELADPAASQALPPDPSP
jgi:hypothetical protein